MDMEIYKNAELFATLASVWDVRYGPREYGIYRMSKPRKKLKGWQKELKRKSK